MNSNRQLDPDRIAEPYLQEAKAQLEVEPQNIQVVGLIANEDKPSRTYTKIAQQKFNAVGIRYDLKVVERCQLASTLLALNEQDTVHGIFIYFPIFHNRQDNYLRNLVNFKKDIEAGSDYWTRKLYANDRQAIAGNANKKALLPCTPLAIIKIMAAIGVYDMSCKLPLADKTVTIFNRSEVIGGPLAMMMSNDGAIVYSFDAIGPLKYQQAKASEIKISRAAALGQSDIVITGVPDHAFPKITTDEIKPGTVCLNFSSTANFAPDIGAHTDVYIPRIGPMTVAMCIRNTLRLFNYFHQV